jgi:hypothetical protein
MPKDYKVFEPNNEHLARIIVRILEEKGYSAGYQLGYPHNKIFIKVEAKEEADIISGIIRRLTEKFRLTGSGLTTDEFNTSISKLSSLIPETPNRKREKIVENKDKKIKNKDYANSKISESEINYNAKLEEWRSKIAERLNLLNTLMTETPNDPSNEKRKIESETLVWVLQNKP